MLIFETMQIKPEFYVAKAI